MGVKKKSQINRLETFATRLSEHSALERSNRKQRARRRGNDASGTLGFCSTICLQRPDVAPLNLSELRAEHFHPSRFPPPHKDLCSVTTRSLCAPLTSTFASLSSLLQRHALLLLLLSTVHFLYDAVTYFSTRRHSARKQPHPPTP